MSTTYLPNTASTDVSFAIVTLKVGAVPEHPPLQFTKLLPAGGTAVSVTTVPSVNFAEQLPPQSSTRSLPEGDPVTVPELLRPTDNVNCDLKVSPSIICPLISSH